ncbi:MAG: helicase C-terminal domain-containing protein [Ignavibacteria bacterium]|jgi:ATP-dependent DNA helicase DinG
MDIRNNIIDFFSEGGILSQKFETYEFRKSQLDMALGVYDSLENKSHIFIEAPTGIGKSFAYLVPAIYYAKENKKKAIISTHTINLQEQLIGKDIPFLQEHLPVDFKAALIKGKNNYLCPKRLKAAYEKAYSLFESDEIKLLDKIYSWSKHTSDGTLSDIPFQVIPNVWSSVCAERGICTGKTCGSIEDTDCFYAKAKHRISQSDVVVVNHHLFFTLFAGVREVGDEGYLYKNDFVIFDEAHTLETVASEHIVPAISREMIKYHLLKLYNNRKQKGFLLSFNSLHIFPLIQNLLEVNQYFFQEIKREIFHYRNKDEKKLALRVTEKNIVKNILKDEIDNLLKSLRGIRQYCKNDLQENELLDYILRFGEFSRLVDDFLKLKDEDKNFVYWVELSSQKEDANISLCVSPVDISEFFRENIFKPNNSCILTSATLTVSNNFEYFKKRLGAEIAGELQLPTQFDFYRQVKLYIPKEMPEPQKENSAIYNIKLKEWIEYFIKMTEGKALVLFTNSFLLRQIGSELRGELANKNIEVFMQGEGISRKNLLNSFKENTNSVLLGLDSFWLGVDVPGESLSNLIITRLPFFVPDHPLIKAKLEFIDLNGGNSFMDYSLPEAILKFRQGIGRLIRHKTDEGIIAVLDPRIIKKSYGKHFFNSIDECPIEIL